MQKEIKILGYVLKVNQAWYITLCIGVILNLGWNYINHKENLELNSTVISQSNTIRELQLENKELKQAIESLLENMIEVNRSFEDFDLEVFNKVKKNTLFISNYYNPAYESKHFTPNGTNRYQNMGRTDFDNAPNWMASIWYKSDSTVALSGKSGVFREPYFKSETREITWANFYKWRRINNLDTLVYGLKLPKY